MPIRHSHLSNHGSVVGCDPEVIVRWVRPKHSTLLRSSVAAASALALVAISILAGWKLGSAVVNLEPGRALAVIGLAPLAFAAVAGGVIVAVDRAARTRIGGPYSAFHPERARGLPWSTRSTHRRPPFGRLGPAHLRRRWIRWHAGTAELPTWPVSYLLACRS